MSLIWGTLQELFGIEGLIINEYFEIKVVYLNNTCNFYLRGADFLYGSPPLLKLIKFVLNFCKAEIISDRYSAKPNSCYKCSS
jgi:hypothetical protein